MNWKKTEYEIVNYVNAKNHKVKMDARQKEKYSVSVETVDNFELDVYRKICKNNSGVEQKDDKKIVLEYNYSYFSSFPKIGMKWMTFCKHIVEFEKI